MRISTTQKELKLNLDLEPRGVNKMSLSQKIFHVNKVARIQIIRAGVFLSIGDLIFIPFILGFGHSCTMTLVHRKFGLPSTSAVNRAVLRELDGLDRLINFIGHPEWSDLHVFAVMVLANCLEDPQNMEVTRRFALLEFDSLVDWIVLLKLTGRLLPVGQAIKENHGLARLVAFITDTASTEEEEVVKKGKGDKDKKAAPSRTGKRGKGDDGECASRCFRN